LRNTSGFAQKNCAKLFSFHEQKFAKNTTGFAQIAQKKVRKTAQNSLRFMRKNSAKVRKKKNMRENCANFAQKLWSFCGNPSRTLPSYSGGLLERTPAVH